MAPDKSTDFGVESVCRLVRRVVRSSIRASVTRRTENSSNAPQGERTDRRRLSLLSSLALPSLLLLLLRALSPIVHHFTRIQVESHHCSHLNFIAPAATMASQRQPRQQARSGSGSGSAAGNSGVSPSRSNARQSPSRSPSRPPSQQELNRQAAFLNSKISTFSTLWASALTNGDRRSAERNH